MSRLPRLLLPILVPSLLGVLAAAGAAQNCTQGQRLSLHFDGVANYVRVPNHPALNNMANFTFELWFRANQNGPSVEALLDHGGSNPFLISLFQSRITVYLDGLQVMQVGPPIQDNVWHHFAVTGSGAQVQAYLDGAPAGMSTYVNPLNASAADMYIGAGWGGGPFYDHFLGNIKDVRIWNIARTSAQINNFRLYTLGGTEPGLVAYYRFDNFTQTVVNSCLSTGNSLNGTLGADTSVAAQDPTPDTLDFPPMFYCVNGTGQPNSAAARLEINGIGTGTAPGTFPVNAAAGSTITFNWQGPINQPFVLMTGLLNTACANLGCIGKIDLGTPPLFGDISLFMNGTQAPGNAFYQLTGAGTASQTFTVPQMAVGLSTAAQGVIFQPGGGCPFVFTTSFKITIT